MIAPSIVPLGDTGLGTSGVSYMEPERIVDLDRYPITELDQPHGKKLVAKCHQELQSRAICLLPGFIRPPALRALVGESAELAPKAYRTDRLRTPYSWRNNKGFPPDHPRSALHPNRLGGILGHQFGENALLRGLYQWAPLTEFVRQALGFATLFPCADPHVSFTTHVMEEGDELAWHFDTNDGVISLLLEQADEGGHFECAPYIRAEDDENYPGLAQLFGGDTNLSIRPDMPPGTFVLFKGRRSCHRVTPVGATRRPRTIAIFSYDEQPGMVFSEATSREYMEPTTDPYYGQTS